MKRLYCLVLFCIVAGFGPPLFSQSLELGRFSSGQLTGWEEKSFAGHTRYTLVPDPDIGQTVLQAISRQSASGLVLKQKINLRRTPILEWSWKVERSTLLHHNHDERQKSGDDYALRLYVIIADGLFFWRTRALNYVWSVHQPLQAAWPSPYTSNSILVALESGPENIGTWRHYRINLLQDIKKYLDLDADHIDAVAIMSDSDNTGTENQVRFGDIRMLPAGQP